MKYLVLIAVIMVVYMLWRSQRRQERQERAERDPHAAPARPAATPKLPQDMVQCDVCLLHLPRTEALAGPDGRLYCCPEHRAGT